MSMVDLKMLSVINNQCKVARSLPRSSPELFGGLPIVILMGDFFQFPPVHGPPLWKNPRYGNDDDAAGRLIWRRFENVIILNEQMRQSEDPSFRDFLTRTRHAALTEDDVIHLNSKSIFSLTDSISDNAVVIAKLIQSTESVWRVLLGEGHREFIFSPLFIPGPNQLASRTFDSKLMTYCSSQITVPRSHSRAFSLTPEICLP